jgi:hypothetical protein
MSTRATAQRFSYGRLIAPALLIVLALGWYQFSVFYIPQANSQLVANNNLSVYVPVQQIQGYLAALLDATYLIISVGVILFAYNLVKLLRIKSGR